ncbi:MAG TPA: adenylate/guanylate cyclase domain-containing protein [Chloroflexota bacterium]|nr:adenylate/guanylate cyclase domain-containing protein [Chloroflexota bacterium]
MTSTTSCTSCGRAIADDFVVCPYCTAPIPARSPTREQRKRVTILFCDITGSTALGETVDPEALRALLVRYFDRMKGIIESHGGMVEKFIGDAVMAVFGVPVLHEDDALRALRAAAEMQAALPGLGIQCRIGVNSGEVVTGTEERLATGDAVNVAARLEQAARPGEILLAEETLRLVRDAVQVEAASPLELKGKRDRVPAYRLLQVGAPVERRRLRAPMIGRERELDRLHDVFAQAVEDRSCQLFTILGTAGVGKSRLAHEFLQGVTDATVVRGRCLSYGEGITYWPVVEIIEQLDVRSVDEYAAAALRQLLGEAQMETSSEEIAWAFRKLLEQQAQEQPLVAVFDDIHWGEDTFLDLIEHVADLSRDVPLLLLCMGRPELLEKRPNWGGGKWNATTVLLELLDAQETDQLLDALGGVDEGLRVRIRQAAEGNPLFVEEMLALINESGGEAVIPPTIQALLAARLDQLEPAERTILQCGAVEGRVFHRNAVRALAEDDANLREILVRLVRKELIRPDRRQRTDDEAYRFRHLLIRDAAYDALPKATRSQLHEKLAHWLDEGGADLGELDEIVGYHLEQAAIYKQDLGQADGRLAQQAGERLAAAGRRAMWRGDTPAATILLERALALLRPVRVDVYLELDLATLQPTAGEAVQMAEAVTERARAAGDRCGELVARLVAAHRRVHERGSIDEMEALAREALPLLEAHADHEGLVHVWRVLGDSANMRCRYEDRARAAEHAIAHARQVDRPGLFSLPPALVLGPRPADEALETLDSLMANEPHPEPRLIRAILLAMLGRFEEAWSVARDASRYVDEPSENNAGPGAFAEIATLQGDDEAAERYWHAHCDYLEARGDLSRLSTYAPTWGRVLCRLGRYDEAEPLAQRGRDLGAVEDIATQLLWRQTRALVLAARGDDDGAERLAREAVEIADRSDGLNLQGDALYTLAEVLEKAGRPDEAVCALEQSLERYERKRNLAMVKQVRDRLAPVIQDR